MPDWLIMVLLIGGPILALGLGIWIGIGAPGWPHKPIYHRRHKHMRPLNPIAWNRRVERGSHLRQRRR